MTRRGYECQYHFSDRSRWNSCNDPCAGLKHSGRDEQAFLITLAGLILVLGWVIPYIYDLFESVQTLFTIS